MKRNVRTEIEGGVFFIECDDAKTAVISLDANFLFCDATELAQIEKAISQVKSVMTAHMDDNGTKT